MSSRKVRTPTSTSSFGVTRREGHDASRFYARFTPPEISTDEDIASWQPADPFICGDASRMDVIPDNSVALVVTSPPYFVGKDYEQAIGEGHVPASYLDYLDMLRRVFAECKRALEPGGRIAVNVANLGRKPYRSLSADVIGILQDDLKFLLRGEIIWQKSEGMSGSCAWGSFRKATNPVLRDTTERVIIASKGRFDRALPVKERRARDLPHRSTASCDEFVEATLDVWRIAAESATRVGHPAPFPVELPQRLIELYTFAGDLVLDPFMGAGSALVAAARSGRRYVGYDIDPTYVEIARRRVAAEGAAADAADEGLLLQTNAEGQAAKDFAEALLTACGFRIVARGQRIPGLGEAIDIVAEDQKGRQWYLDVSGAFTTPRAGLLRSDTLWRTLGRVLALQTASPGTANNCPIILLTTTLPRRKSAEDAALRALGWRVIFDAVELLSPAGQQRLREYATGEHPTPIAGFWMPAPP